jgi:hypothetical protein
MSETHCPFCNRVLVQKSDQSQLCMFCGWKSPSATKKQVRKTDQNLNQPHEKATGKLSEPAPVRKKSQAPADKPKIATSAEEIARQQLQQENSRQQVTLVTVAAIILLGLVVFQMCRPSTPEVEPEAMMTPSVLETTREASPAPMASSFSVQSAAPQPTAPLATTSPEATPTATPSPTPTASESPTASPEASPEASATPSEPSTATPSPA